MKRAIDYTSAVAASLDLAAAATLISGTVQAAFGRPFGVLDDCLAYCERRDLA